MAENESDLDPDQKVLRDEARQLALDAGQRIWDSYGVIDPDLSDAVVTGYVVVAEAVLRSGYTSLAWMSGNGQPPGTDGMTGLASHRVDGLLRHVIQELYSDRGSSE